MKQYFILFLIMMSHVCYAPNLITFSKPIHENNENLAIIQAEEKADSIDISYFKALRIKENKQFTKEDRKKLREVAKQLGIKSKWLYKVIFIESGFNPKAVNFKSGATGLIQWIPSSAIACGTTTKDLYKMSVSQQLDYIKIYFKLALNGKKIRTFSDLYLAVFSPNAIGKPDSYVIGSKNSKVVLLNKSFMNNDSTITTKDIKEKLLLTDIIM